MPKNTNKIPSDTGPKIPIFPADVLPDLFKNLAFYQYECTGIHCEYTYVSLLMAVAAIIGNNRQLRIKRTWIQKPLLWMLLVGPSGLAKSHPITFALSPHNQIDSDKHKYWENELQNYKDNDSKGKRPQREKIVLQQFTTEAIAQVHQYNSKGMIVWSDEAKTWLSITNGQYKKGSDESQWLTLHGGGPLDVIRATKDPIRVNETCINVLAGMVLDTAKALIENERDINGFFGRLMFALPSSFDSPHTKESDIPQALIDKYYDLIKNSFIYSDSLELTFTPDASKRFNSYSNSLKDRSNEADGIFQTTLKKGDNHAARLALILELLQNPKASNVSLSTLENAIKLNEYFISCAEWIVYHLSMSDTEKAQNKITERYRPFYYALPDEPFTKADATNTATNLGLNGDNAYAWMKRSRKLFEDGGHDLWKKK